MSANTASVVVKWPPNNALQRTALRAAADAERYMAGVALTVVRVCGSVTGQSSLIP